MPANILAIHAVAPDFSHPCELELCSLSSLKKARHIYQIPDGIGVRPPFTFDDFDSALIRPRGICLCNVNAIHGHWQPRLSDNNEQSLYGRDLLMLRAWIRDWRNNLIIARKGS